MAAISFDKIKKAFVKDGLVDRTVAIFLFTMVAFVVIFMVQNRDPKPYSPLGYYSTQQVGYDGQLVDSQGQIVTPTPKQLLPTHLFEGDLDPLPMLTVETGLETLPVHAEKCLDTDTPVHVVGEVRWRNVTPAGAVIQGSKGTVDRQPGCQSFDYKLALPTEVLTRLQIMASEGIRYSKWQIQGEETPTQEPNAITKYWNSTDFVLHYVGEPAVQATTTTTTSLAPVNPFPDQQ